MKLALVLVILLAAVGPIAIPIALRKGLLRARAFSAFCLTNAITVTPMIALVVWARHFPPPSCREIYPDAPCDGIPYDAGWFILTLLFGLLALWGLIGSSVTTLFAFRGGASREI